VEHVATLELIPDLRAPRAARTFAAETLAAWDVSPPDVEAVQLVVSELVTNALRHAPDSPAVTLQLARMDDCIRVLVSDEGPGDPEQNEPDPGSGVVSGRGLWLVDAFTERWGTARDERGGKTVWGELRTGSISKG
jgi:anti-sigma regulatory factor (Ser/Thr protein kinase)